MYSELNDFYGYIYIYICIKNLCVYIYRKTLCKSLKQVFFQL